MVKISVSLDLKQGYSQREKLPESVICLRGLLGEKCTEHFEASSTSERKFPWWRK